MKIDGNTTASDAQAAEAARRTAETERVQRGGGNLSPAASGDRLSLSPDARLAAAAISAAQQEPPIRAALVEQMRQKLDAGEVGRDSEKLADRLIDALLER